jgi:hypothetical protein
VSAGEGARALDVDGEQLEVDPHGLVVALALARGVVATQQHRAARRRALVVVARVLQRAGVVVEDALEVEVDGLLPGREVII